MPKSQKKAAIQTIDELQVRYQRLAEEKIKVETQRDSAQQQLQEIKADALEQFGSDDLNTLKARLADMKTNNDQKRIDYQKQLDQIEQKLVEIDEQFVAAELDEE
jgi:hypothetical protein